MREFLADPGRRARIYADLARSLRPDVLVVDSGSGWDLNPAGHALIADLLTRVKAVVPTTLGVVADRTRDPRRSTGRAGRGARGGRGRRRRDLRARGRRRPPDGYARIANPLWGSLKFFRAVGVLQGAVGGGVPRGPFLPCVDVADRRPHALAVAPGEAATAVPRRRARHPHRGSRRPRPDPRPAVRGRPPRPMNEHGSSQAVRGRAARVRGVPGPLTSGVREARATPPRSRAALVVPARDPEPRLDLDHGRLFELARRWG